MRKIRVFSLFVVASTINALKAVAVGIFVAQVFITACGFISGAFSANYGVCEGIPPGKWQKVFPFVGPACTAGVWMGEE